MVERIQAEMATSIALDTLKATNSLRGLNDAVNSVKNAWKAQEAAAKSSGDYLKASQERYSGLSREMDAQKNKITELQQRQKGLDTSTKEGAESFLKYEKNIQQANQKLASLESQQQRAKSSMEYQSSGLAKLQQEYKQMTQVSDSYVNRLKAEGKERLANITSVNSMKSSLSNLSQQYVKQSEELKRVETTSGSASEAYRKQSIRVNETATSIANMKKDLKLTQAEVNRANPYGLTKYATGANAAYRAAEKMGNGFQKAGQKIKDMAYSSSIAIVGIGAATIKGANDASELENAYIKIHNLLVTGGEKAAEVTKNVTQMQKDGLKYSTEYGVSQQKIADGYEELVKRGYTSNQSLGAQKTLLETARASGDDYSDVIKNTATTLENFGLKVDDTNRMMKNTKQVANQMAFAADMTATDFSKMGTSMEYVGASAHQSGFEIAETASAIGILSNNGLEADKAGTGLRKVINSLQSPTKTARNALNELGLSTSDFVDKSGKMKSMTDIFSLLNEKTKDMSQSKQASLFHYLFGSTGQAAGGILANNAQALGELNKKVKASADGQGYVHELSKKNMQSTKAQLEQLKVTMQNVGMTIGKDMLPELTRASNDIRKSFNSKEGQEGIKTIAKGIKNVTDVAINLVEYLGSHKNEVKAFGITFASIWAFKKISDTVGWLKNAIATYKELNGVLKITAGLNAVSFPSGGITKSAASLGKQEISGLVADGALSRSTAGGAVRLSDTAVSEAGILSKMAPIMSKAIPVAGIAAALLPALKSGYSAVTAKDDVTKAKGTGGSLGGGAGALAGGLIGSIGGPVGIALGASIGGALGNKLGKQAGEAYQKGFKESHPQSINAWIGTQWEDTFKKPSSLMKNFSKSYQKQIDSLNKNAKIKFGVDSKDVENAKAQSTKTYADIYKGIDKFYQNKQKLSKQDLKTLVANGNLTQQQANKILQNSQKNDNKSKTNQQKLVKDMKNISSKYYSDVEKLQKGGSDKLKKIEEQYGKGSKTYKKELNKELAKLQSNYVDDMAKKESNLNTKISVMTKTANKKQSDLLADLNSSKKRLTEKGAHDVIVSGQKERDTLIKAAQETRDKSVDSANDKYKKSVAAADKEYYQNGSISRKQHDEIVKNARKQRDDSIDAAETERQKSVKSANSKQDEIVSAAEKQAKLHKGAIDKETGWISDGYNNQNQQTTNIINGIVDGLNGFLNGIHKGWGGIPRMKYKGYANGTRGLLSDEIALVGEEGFELAHSPLKGIYPIGTKGPEIRHLDAGTSILPHGMSKQFMKMVENLPSHKDGVLGTLSDTFDWVKDKVKDADNFIGKGAKSAVDWFADKVGYSKLSSLADGSIKNISIGGVDKAKESLINKVKEFFDKYNEQNEGGSGKGSPSGSGVTRWTDQVKEALKANNLSTSSDMVNKVLRQIQTESGGNEKAVQGGYTDVNTLSGDLAKGLMQTISATFNAYAFPGHKNIFNGYDNLLAGLAYAKNRYGSNLSYLGQGHGYANGTITNTPHLANIAEGGMTEAVIPWDLSKKSRAMELLGETVTHFAQNTSSSTDVSGSTDSNLANMLEATNKTLSSVVELLAGILGQTTAANQSVDDITMNKFSKAIISRAVRSAN
ncbi:MAG: hypothetical protein [Bacteriophage sp.]|nr:MAG: hypothetical protein [Bacteriophage sp.]